MKVAITGATGYIGAAVETALEADDSVTHIVALSRRKLDSDSSKISTFIKTDYASYPADEIEAILDCDAMIWCLGNGSHMVSQAEKEVVMYDWPRTLVNSLLPHLEKRTTPFRFVLIGSFTSELDQQKLLWVLSAVRKSMGAFQTSMAEQAATIPNYQFYAINAAFVIEKKLAGLVLGDRSIYSRDLALAMLNALALH